MAAVPTFESVRGALLRFRVMAFVVGVTLLAFCAAIVWKYALDGPEDTIVAQLHGFLFMIYALLCLDLGFRAIGRSDLRELARLALARGLFVAKGGPRGADSPRKPGGRFGRRVGAHLDRVGDTGAEKTRGRRERGGPDPRAPDAGDLEAPLVPEDGSSTEEGRRGPAQDAARVRPDGRERPRRARR